MPLTQEGTLLVEGVYVSCYASYSHALAHDFLAPARAFPSLLRLRPGLLEQAASTAKKIIWKTLSGILGLEKWEEACEEDGEEEGEGEAYLVSVVKEIGRLWYTSEQAAPYVLQVRPAAPPDSLLQKLWLSVPLPRAASSFLGILARSW